MAGVDIVVEEEQRKFTILRKTECLSRLLASTRYDISVVPFDITVDGEREL
jgi:hypothetical protein